MKQKSDLIVDTLLSYATELFYPRTCPACLRSLCKGEELICINCLIDTPSAHIHDENNNIVENRLGGKSVFECATALYYFQKGSKAQKLVHQLKYKGNTKLAFYLGEILGRELNDSIRFDDLDIVIPVPLHKKRMEQRGYNQSKLIADGIAEALQIPVSDHNLIRKTNTKTQTKKTIYERWLNVSSIFECKDPLEFHNKNILLVDDVITSGSTLEACINTLSNIDGVKVFVAVIACAE